MLVIDVLISKELENAKIPIASVTGTNGQTTTSCMVSHMWKKAGKVVGLITTDGVYMNGKFNCSMIFYFFSADGAKESFSRNTNLIKLT